MKTTAVFTQEIEISLDDLKDLYENLITESDDDGRVIAEMFMQLPDKVVSTVLFRLACVHNSVKQFPNERYMFKIESCSFFYKFRRILFSFAFDANNFLSEWRFVKILLYPMCKCTDTFIAIAEDTKGCSECCVCQISFSVVFAITDKHVF